MRPPYFKSFADTGEASAVRAPAVMSLEKPTSLCFYRPELDTLRFFAFLGVFVVHVIPNEPYFYLNHHLLPPMATRLIWAHLEWIFSSH